MENLEKQVESHNQDVVELLATAQQLSRESDALNNLQQSTEVTIDQLDEKVQQLEEKQQSRDVYLRENPEIISDMQLKIDDLEQCNKKNHLRIVGLVEEDGEDIIQKVVDLAKEKLNIMSAKASDFEDIQRMGPKDYKPNRDVLVICTNSTMKNQLYKRRKCLRDYSEPIFINEELTSKRSRLFYHARLLRKRSKIFGVWSQNGNIMVKLVESSQPKAVQDYETLKQLILTQQGEGNQTDSEFSNRDEETD